MLPRTLLRRPLGALPYPRARMTVVSLPNRAVTWRGRAPRRSWCCTCRQTSATWTLSEMSQQNSHSSRKQTKPTASQAVVERPLSWPYKQEGTCKMGVFSFYLKRKTAAGPQLPVRYFSASTSTSTTRLASARASSPPAPCPLGPTAVRWGQRKNFRCLRAARFANREFCSLSGRGAGLLLFPCITLNIS